MDLGDSLGVSFNPDGTLNRPSLFPLSPPCSDEQASVYALSKDITLNATKQTSLRLYLPKTLPITNKKLPVIIYFHGGGFVFFSPAVSFEHEACVLGAANIPALIVSVDYRLAPEHRLPAAYDDAVEALLWVRDQARSSTEPWMRDHADFAHCFIMGSSAGGNIAYNLGLCALHVDVEPLNISGLILNQPYFGGVERTESEARSENDVMLPLKASDSMWAMALPEGTARDHEYCNPAVAMAKAKGLPRCLVRGFAGDPLIDRMQVLAPALEKEGVRVVRMMKDGGSHGIDFFDPEKGKEAVDEFRSFIYDD